MKYTLKIECDNAAFEPAGCEVARILREAATCIEQIDRDRTKYTLRDINGNKVGYHGFSS